MTGVPWARFAGCRRLGAMPIEGRSRAGRAPAPGPTPASRRPSPAWPMPVAGFGRVPVGAATVVASARGGVDAGNGRPSCVAALPGGPIGWLPAGWLALAWRWHPAFGPQAARGRVPHPGTGRGTARRSQPVAGCDPQCDRPWSPVPAGLDPRWARHDDRRGRRRQRPSAPGACGLDRRVRRFAHRIAGSRPGGRPPVCHAPGSGGPGPSGQVAVRSDQRAARPLRLVYHRLGQAEGGRRCPTTRLRFGC